MTWKICISGMVQGVGFRPFVWRTAIDQNLTGSVANGLEGVVVLLNGSRQKALEFQDIITKNAPKLARITQVSCTSAPDTFFDSFTIVASDNQGQPVLLLTPDVAICPACRKAIHTPDNRRWGYAFTTCTVCGPRFSILTGVPYDRPFTTMQDFPMCADCRSEYQQPSDERFYAQTNSCAKCGVTMWLVNSETNPPGTIEPTDPELIRKQVVDAWEAGSIVAIKGIGGFLLTCDACNPDSISRLRERKHRPTKPFAVMYPNLELLQTDAEVSDAAFEHLTSPVAPIVLLPLKSGPTQIDRKGIAPGLHTVGAMLPNAPLLDLLLRDFGRPIVATSGNISGAPLDFEDNAAIEHLSDIADLMLLHNRRIVMPQDDSVVAIRTQPAPTNHVVIRRARGMAPCFIQPGLSIPETTVLALGAEMKGTMALAHLGNINISQYLGDLSDFAVQERYHLILNHLLRVFEAQPAVILGDLHPGYFTTQLGQDLASKWNVPFYQVQHHEAHFAAVLTENNLLKPDMDPVLGIIWDGTGYGTDGKIWGGEFFTYASNKGKGAPSIQRVSHFDYFPFILGDKMPREPRLSAFSTCWGIHQATDLLRLKFTDQEWNLYQKLPKQPGQLMTSSVGRIFDAVASLLGLADKMQYEAEAALLLEDLARQYSYEQGPLDVETFFDVPIMPFVDTKMLMEGIINDLQTGQEPGRIALKFHYTMVNIIQKAARWCSVKKIAFSGGVFQNTLLVDLIQHQLGQEFELFFHRQLSPNDENIAFGQWAHFTSCLN